MKKQKPRRPRPSQPRTPRAAPAQASPPDDRRVEILLTLWARMEHTLDEIAAAMDLSMKALLRLLREPEIRAMLRQIERIAERRARLAVTACVPKAARTLQAVCENQPLPQADDQAAEAESTEQTGDQPSRPLTASQRQTQRNRQRLAATAILTHHRALRRPNPKPAAKRRPQLTTPPQVPDAVPQPIAA